jgi:chemotaxis protein CheD
MNHYMLPGDDQERGAVTTGSARYGTCAMALLLGHVLQLGAKRANLLAKVFGAGRVMEGMSDVGSRNSDFAIHYLRQENIRMTAVDVGDIYPTLSPELFQEISAKARNQGFLRQKD